MSKTLRTAALIVGAVALAATGVGALAEVGALGTIAAGSAAAATLATISTVATVASLAAGALTLAATLTAPKPTVSGSPESFTANPDQGVPYAMGRTAVAGWIIHRGTSDTTGTTNRYQTIFSILSGAGPIDSYEGFKVDKTSVTFSGGDDGDAIGYFADFMWQRRQLGLTPEPDALVGAGFVPAIPGWGPTAKLSGYAAYGWTLKFDKKGKKYGAGVPQPQMVGKWVKCYDPRLDSTYPGGSGTCRALDETTYVWSQNPFVHAITWLLGRWQNGKRVLACGIPLALIDMPAYVEAANVADANGWTIGGVVFSTDGKWNALKQICQAGGGAPCQNGALVSCTVNAPRVSLATITREDIIGRCTVPAMKGRRDRINGIVPKYRSEEHEWTMVAAKVARVADYVTADGGTRTREVEYSLVQDVDQATQLAYYDVVNAREFGPITVPLKLKYIGYKQGDCLTIAVDELGMTAQKVLVGGKTLDPATAAVTLSFMSETDAKHPFCLGKLGTAPPTPGLQVYDPDHIPAPDVGSWEITGTSTISQGKAVPALVVEGVVDNPNADAVKFEYRVHVDGQADDAGWISEGLHDEATVKRIIKGVNLDSVYDVAVSYRVDGVMGDRLILDSAETGSSIGPSTTVFRPVTSTSYPLLTEEGQAGPVRIAADASGNTRVAIDLTYISDEASVTLAYELRVREVDGPWAVTSAEQVCSAATNAGGTAVPGGSYFTNTYTGLNPGQIYEWDLIIRRSAGTGSVTPYGSFSVGPS